MADPLHDVRFPGESAAYRASRDELLAAEIDLRRRTEAVAAMRRRLPLGGLVPEDHRFQEGSTRHDSTRSMKLSELFAPGKDTLVVYSFMFGTQMPSACPSCTSILDGLDGESQHIRQRVEIVVVAKSPLPRILAHAKERGWRSLRLLSSADNAFNRDYHAEVEDGSQRPALHVFVRRDARVHHAIRRSSSARRTMKARTRATSTPSGRYGQSSILPRRSGRLPSRAPLRRATLRACSAHGPKGSALRPATAALSQCLCSSWWSS